MAASLAPIWRDTLVRYQQTAMRETGRRPLAHLRVPMDEDLLLPGCRRAGYAFWQPIAWVGDAPLGSHARHFHQSIIDYVSLCQFLELRFCLPVARKGSPLSFLHGRVFETCKNTCSAPPERAFAEALLYQRQQPQLPLCYTMAVTCDGGEPLVLLLQAQDGQALVLSPAGTRDVLQLKLGLDRLLPKLQFVYDV